MSQEMREMRKPRPLVVVVPTTDGMSIRKAVLLDQFCKEMSRLFDNLQNNIPATRELALALTSIEDAAARVVKAILEIKEET